MEIANSIVVAVCSLEEPSTSVWPHDRMNTVVNGRQSEWCPAHVDSEEASVNTTEVTQQKCSVSFMWQPTNHLTLLVDLCQQDRYVE